MEARGVLLAAVILLAASAEASFTSRINGISEDLSAALNRLFARDDTVFTDLDENATYISDTLYNARGMGGLYNITHWFMDLVLPKDVFPEGFVLKTDNGAISVDNIVTQWQSILKHYAGLLTITVLAVIFAVMVPFVGFIFCCCRLCGNCGARSQPFDKKHDLCRKILLAMLLIGVGTLMLFGIVCAFVSNKHMQEGTEEFPNSLRDGISDTRTYINHTNKEINVLLVTNFNELADSLEDKLNSSSDIVFKELQNFANAASFLNLAAFIEGLDGIKANLTYMEQSTKVLRVNASQLNDGLRRVKNELLHSLNNCTSKECQDIRNQVNNMSTTMDFDNLPDISSTLTNLIRILDGGIIEQIKKGKDSFMSIQTHIHNAVKDNIPKVSDAIKSAGAALKGGADNITNTLSKVDNTISQQTKLPIDEAEKYINEYSVYRYYAGLAESCILLIVIICITFGLMCGICGKRPDGYDDDCCNKGAGSRFLMIAVAIMFLFSIVLMAITLAYFLIGVISQRLLCDTFRNPEDKKLFTIADQFLNISTKVNANVSDIIQACHQNKSAYTVLHLENKMDMKRVGEYLEEFKINEKIEEFEKKINLNDNIVILNQAAKDKIAELQASGLSDIKFYRFMEILKYNITSIDLNELAEKLLEAERHVSPDAVDFRMSLKQNALYLQTYQRSLVDPMVETAETLKHVAEKLDTQLKFNRTDFNDAMNVTIHQVEEAQNIINGQGRQKIKELARDFGEGFKMRIQKYLDHVVNQTTEHIGQCGPISNVFNATLLSTCDKILNPWNGFWLSVGWCLLLFIPTIVLSVKLASLYQKSDPYPGPEVEYLYDAYADRDNIPLSNVSHKKNRKKKKRNGGGDSSLYDSHGYPGESGRGGGERERPAPRERDAPGGSSHPDTRYADMAPKHWEDYPNGGPPQYQSAPLATEYERPPPYYYPGPGVSSAPEEPKIEEQAPSK